MKKTRIFCTNGFVVKSLEEQENYQNRKNYFGIGRYVSWPLEDCTDSISIQLTKIANEQWFGYQDKRSFVIPEFEFLKEYKKHCERLGISTICLQVESMEHTITSAEKPSVEEILGFDYADSDMVTSCFCDDMEMCLPEVKKHLAVIERKRNKFGLLNSLEDMYQYLTIREMLVAVGYDMEEYYNPKIVRLSRIIL